MKFNFLMVVLALILFGSVSLVLAEPSGPTSATELGSSRYSTAPGANISAIAGNVTELNFVANSITRTWQGYFGNISGQIVLGNANNRTLYDWNFTSISGQVYATRTPTTPAWTSIKCANDTEIATEDTALGVDQLTDADSVNRTFLNGTVFTPFYVGNTLINGSETTCYTTYLNDPNGDATSSFTQTVLSDTTNFIYTALIAPPTNGFDNRSHQFQMLVGEDGHLGDTASTPYYFYLELS